jgi:dihydrodipicolinate synthase/N-acetylneuraminate lyase
LDRNSVNWYGPMPAVVTPFKENGAIDDGAFVENLEGLLAAGATGFIVGGCTGEFWAMTIEERKHVFRLSAKTVKRRGTVIAGTSAIRIDEVIELTQAAQDAGCDGALVLPPYFVELKESEIIRHFETLSATVSLPVMLYNIPQFCNNAVTPSLADRLADLETVVAIKESAGDWVNFHNTLIAVRDRLRVFCGPSTLYGVPAVAAGADGFVDCFPNVWRPGGLDLYHAAVAGDHDRARSLQQMGLALTHLFTSDGRTLYSATKTGMNLLGLPGGLPRPPLDPTTPSETDGLRDGLIRWNLLEG